jgi:polyhydroxyalkanoate synthase
MAAIGLFDMLERLNPSGAAMNSPVDAALLATVPDGKDVPAEGSGKASSTTIPQADLMADTAIARVTGGISPAAVGNAYVDWLTHLAMSPARRSELVNRAAQRCRHMLLPRYDASSAVADSAGDKRFADPAWQRWPYNWLVAAFTQTEQWWGEASHGVRGVSRHHADVVDFTTRQWLDFFAPSNFVATNPVVLDETLKSGGANLVYGTQRMLHDWERNCPGSTVVDDDDDDYRVGVNVAVTPGKVVYRNRLMELIQYEPACEKVHERPMLIVPAWIMKYYILDLSPENSLVNYLVDQGYTVFMISWKNPGGDERDMGLDDYRTLGIMTALDEIGRITGAPDANAVGYCLGGTNLAITAAAMARDKDKRIASVSLFAAQVDFEEPGELSLFIDESQVAFLEAIIANQGYLDTKQMAGAFQMLRSNDLIYSHYINQYLMGKPEPKSDLMAWNADATRMPYRMHSQYLRSLFLRNDLAENRYRVNGKVVSLGDIRVPVFAVGTVTDHVAPWKSVYKIHQAVSGEVSFVLTTGGHNAGVVSPPAGSHRHYQIATHARKDGYVDAESWQRAAPSFEGSWWPAWERWLAQRSGVWTAPPAMGQALCDAPGNYVLER